MKWVVEHVEQQIKQLEHSELKEWLLRHLNLAATHLTELFSKQVSSDFLAPSSLNRVLPLETTSQPLLVLIYAYAPDSLVEQFIAHDFSRSLPEYNCSAPDPLVAQLIAVLNDFRSAWPIIESLQSKTPYAIIEVLKSADESCLSALARLINEPELKRLVELFLLKSMDDLGAINRQRLIGFLRTPDFAQKLNHFVAFFNRQAANLVSIRFLQLAFSTSGMELAQLQKMQQFISAYPFPLHAQVLWLLLPRYQTQLHENIAINLPLLSLLSCILAPMNNAERARALLGLPPQCLALLLEYCVRGGIEDGEIKTLSLNLLLLICSPAAEHEDYALVLRRTLNQIPLYSLAESAIQQPVQEIGRQDTEPFWNSTLVRMLLAPAVIAETSPDLVQKLILRIQCLMLTLNSAQLINLLTSCKGCNPFFVQLLPALQQTAGTDKNRLINWSIERISQALFAKLARQCEQFAAIEPKLAERALSTLYTFLAQRYVYLRADLLLALTGFMYPKAAGNFAASIPASWLKKYPHKDEGSTAEASLYNKTGQVIAWLDEANYVWTYSSGQMVALVDTELNTKALWFYNHQGQIIGHLHETGYFISAYERQKNISVLLLTSESVDDLERKPIALKLVLKQVLVEETLAIIYDSLDLTKEEDKARRRWLTQQFFRTLLDIGEVCSLATLQQVSRYFPSTTLFELLSCIRHPTNAVRLFYLMIEDDTLYGGMIKGFHTVKLSLFLQRFAAQGLVEFLVNYSDRPRFIDGLRIFAGFAKKTGQPFLLSTALTLLARQEHPGQLDTVLRALISSAKLIYILCKEFIALDKWTAIQNINSPEFFQVLPYFNKAHLLMLIGRLNQQPCWDNRWEYLLVLAILYTQFSLQNNKATAWQEEELLLLSGFISRHLTTKNNLDKDGSIGSRVFGELVFRCAFIGQTSLFYQAGRVNPVTVRPALSNIFLAKLVDDFWLPEAARKKLATVALAMSDWLSYRNAIAQHLQEYQIFQDWHSLITGTNKIALITIYLLNYSGPKQPALQLLNDLFTHFYKKKGLIHAVSELLVAFPEREISAVVFDALYNFILKTPGFLDAVLFRQMAAYYAKKMGLNPTLTGQAECALLAHWGQGKHYALFVSAACILIKSGDNSELERQLITAIKHAYFEQKLAQLMPLDSRFKQILFQLKRLWHYGFGLEKNSSPLVALCNKAEDAVLIPFAADKIKIASQREAITTAQCLFTRQLAQFTDLLTAVLCSSLTQPAIKNPSFMNGQSIFQQSERPLSPIAENGTGKAAVVTV